MRVVDIFRRRPADAEIEHLARLVIRNPGDPAELQVQTPEFRDGLEQMMAMGAADDDGRWFHLEDGEAFLDAALVYFRGSRFWAAEVDVPEP